MSGVVKLQASDGHELDAYVAEPDGKPWGALVVVQEIFGVNQHMRSVADRFAQEGFYAVVPALFDRVEPNVELTDDGMQKGTALAQKIDVNDALKDVDAALRYAAKKTGKPAGVVGYCYGGTLAWLSATRLSPAAAVGYYGGQIGRFALESPARRSCFTSGSRMVIFPRLTSRRCMRPIRRWRSVGMTPAMLSITTRAPATTQKQPRKPWPERSHFSIAISDPCPEMASPRSRSASIKRT